MEQNGRKTRDHVEFGPFTLVVSERRLERNGVPVKLGSRALDILSLLTQKPGQIVQKRELLDHVWPGMVVEENTLRVHIKDIRKALEDSEHSRYIVNVPGRGYGFLLPEEKASITSHKQPSAPAGGQHLPPRPRRIIGRDDAIQAVTELVLDKRFVTLHGPGGIGKTTMATVVAHAIAPHFEDGAFFIDIGTLTEPGFVPAVLCSTLGLLSSSDDPSTALIDFLKTRQALIVLDCCEHLIDVVADLAERIFQWAPDVCLLATSREPLRVNGEHVYSVGPLELPSEDRELTAEEILASPAVAFFVQHAQASGPLCEFNASNAKLALQICRRLNGIALAMELAAMRAGMHGLDETANLLNSHLQLEWKGRRTASRRHQTLYAMLNWSHDLISEDERRVLRRLSIFVGAFVLDDAQKVASDDQITSVQVIEILAQLVAKSLVSSYTEDQVVRYRMLDTTRAYAHDKLVEAGEAHATSWRHALHCKDFLLRTSPEPTGVVLAEHRRIRAAFLGNAREALKWCFSADGDKQLGVELAAAAVSLFIELSLIGECRRWAEQGLNWMNPGVRGGQLELQLQGALGHSLMFTVGNDDQAQMALKRGLQIVSSISNPRAEFKLLSHLHMYYRRTGELRKLPVISERAWAIATYLQDPVALAAAHVLYGVSYHLLGDQKQARTHVDDLIHRDPIVQRVLPGHFAFHRPPQILIARALWLQGYPDKAVRVARRVTSQLAPSMDAVTSCIALIWATSVFVWVGDWEAVEENANRLINLTERHGLKPYLSIGRGLLGQVALARHDLDIGISMLREAVSSLQRDRYELYSPELSCALALSLALRGRPDQALAIIDETMERVTKFGGAFSMPEILRIRGEVLIKAADERGAITMFANASTLAEDHGALGWRLRAETSLARVSLRQGKEAIAIYRLQETFERFNEGFNTMDLKIAKALIDQTK